MTGMYATVAIQAALAHRERSGEGQWIDTISSTPPSR
jgi:formyl-CoA transferase